jgi:YbbR domain-containing protein
MYVSYVYGAKVTNSSLYPVQIQNAPTNYQISLAKENVEVTFEAPSNTIEEHTKNISVYLDFSEIQSGTHKMKPIVKAPTNVDVRLIDPPLIEVTVEEIISKEFSIKIILMGNLESGNIAGEPIASPESVRISGTESAIQSIHNVFVEVDLTNANADILSHSKVFAQNNANQSIPGLTIEPESVQISVPVLNTDISKVLPIVPHIIGSPLGTIQSITVEPYVITVSGNVKFIESLQSIETEPISIDQKNATFSKEVSILLPEGVRTVQNRTTVRVTVSIESIESMTFKDIPISILNLPFNLNYSMEISSIHLTVYGLSSKLQQLKTIEAFIDVQGLEAGSHTIPIQLRYVPEDVIVQAIPKEVTIQLFLIESESLSPPILLSTQKHRGHLMEIPV